MPKIGQNRYVQSNPQDLVTCMGDCEILSVSGRLTDYLGELARMRESLRNMHLAEV